MIGKNVQKFCCEDISLIENYNQAVNDPEIWDCHHRLETDPGLSRHELIDRNLYYDRPASELIFLTKAEHRRLHRIELYKDPEERQKQSIRLKGKNNGKHHSEESNEKNRQAHLGKEPWNKGKKMSKEFCMSCSEGRKGKEPWNKGKKGVMQAWNKGMTKEEMKNYKKK